jgi:hypothetical protein
MSKVKIQGNASGTGVVTLTAPNTNTDRTITLPDGDISLGVGIDDNATSTAITIDASENVEIIGNVGIGGVTPENWNGARPGLQIGSTGSISGKDDVTDNQMNVTANAFLNRTSLSTGWDYMYTNKATNYYQQDGKHVFRVAPSGTADSAITWTDAMTIDNDGIVTMPNQPIISLDGTAGSTTVSAGYIITSLTPVVNQGGMGWSSGRVTVPVAGVYQIHLNVYHYNVGGCRTIIKINGVEASLSHSGNSTTADESRAQTIIRTVGPSDYIEFGVSSGSRIYLGNRHTFASVQKIA